MRFILLFSCLSVLIFSSCRESRIHEHNDWGKYFEKEGIKNGCIIIRDNNHEAIHYYNKERCLERFLPASTFKIFNSVVALETGIAPDDQLIIKWDSVARQPEWDKDMNMREAFKVSCVPYYQEIARRIGPAYMQHYLDTIQYGNMEMGSMIDQFWLNDTLKISADEQVGFLKRLYFAELPVSERSQRIVKSMMLQEQTPEYNLYYKAGWGDVPGKHILWLVGFSERVQLVKEHKESMNKSNERLYPYFFAMNFEVPANDTSKDLHALRLSITKNILKDFGALTPLEK